MNTNKAKLIAEAILESKKTSVLTGAGISTESGIPDFRSPGTGLWSRFDPNMLSSDILYNKPVKFYRLGIKILKFIASIKKAKPNRAHYILAEMEKEELVSAIITQNIDGLHLKAGSKKVYEVHGNLREGYCISCEKRVTFGTLISKVMRGQIPPICNSCGGVLRVDVVLFGDELPQSYIEATKEVEKSDLLLVVGSSLEVSPVNNLPSICKRFIIINKERTDFDSMAYVVWNEKASVALNMIYKEIKKRNAIIS